MRFEQLINSLRGHAQRTPHKPAVIGDKVTVTYRDLVERVEREAEALSSLGLARGERVLFRDEAKASYLTALLACARQGLTFVPVHPQAPDAWREAVAARLGVAAKVDGAAALREGRADLRGRRLRSEEDDVLAILMTSGTTGEAQAVPVHAAMAAAGTANVLAAFGLNESAVFLDYIPPFTVGGLFLTGLPQLMAGGTSVTPPFSPFTFPALLDAHRPTHAILLPTMVALLRRSSAWATLDLSCFEAVASGATTVPESVGNELLARGASSFLHLFGMTECLTPILLHRATRGPSPKTVFSEVCGDYEMRLAADGELLLRGSAVMRGYLGDGAQNAAAFADGWFKTGDLFVRDGDGWRFVGRKKEILKVGGLTVSPALTEKVILDLPGVRNCVVVKETLRSGGEALVAVVEGGEAEARRVIEHCQGRLPPAQVPRRVVVVAQIPVNAMRKVDRPAAARMLTQHA